MSGPGVGLRSAGALHLRDPGLEVFIVLVDVNDGDLLRDQEAGAEDQGNDGESDFHDTERAEKSLSFYIVSPILRLLGKPWVFPIAPLPYEIHNFNAP
jgi:hypothetical protein